MKTLPLLLFLFSFHILANGQLEITDIEGANELIGEYIEIYIDSSNNLSVNQINSDKYLSHFIALPQFQEELDNSNTYWLHLALRNKLDKSVSLGLNIPKYNHVVDVHCFWDEASQVQHTGFYRSGHENDEIIPVTNMIQLPDQASTEVFISIRNVTDEKPEFQLDLVDIREEISRNLRQKIFDAFLLGMMGIMICYGLFLFFHNRDRLYIYYSFYIIFLCGWYFFCFEFGYSLVPRLPREIYPYSDIPVIVAMVFYLEFAKTFLNVPQKLPKWNRIITTLQIIFIIQAIVVFLIMIVTKRFYLGYYLNASYALILIAFVCVFILRVFRSKIQFSKIFVLGSFFLIIGFLLGLMIWLINGDQAMLPQKLGTILELAVFTYGISFRYKVLKEDKELYQQQVIEQLEENTRFQEKANRELEGKVKERTIEISEKNVTLQDQNEEIKAQNDLLLVQHNSIQESIRYASRIQSAILPKDEALHHFLPKHFILFKPRDVVSGDFYWLGSKSENIVIAAVDCTGHGVPGAFMSMLGTSLLNDIINSQSPLTSSEVLDELRDRIILSLRQTGREGEAKDGMDMGLCIIDRNHHKLTFSGANNNLIIIRNGELRELKGDRMPIGISPFAGRPFIRHEFDLVKGDTIYMYSDGFPDQFGGPRGKKFLTSRFKQVLLDIQDQIMYEQKESLEKELHEWMNPGDPSTEIFEQIDDILVIGIKI